MCTISLETVAPDETPFCGTHHSLGDHAGYVVVLTQSGHGKVVDFDTYESGQYGQAVEDAHMLRLAAPKGSGYYARIDVVYSDGCRGIC